MMHVFKTSNFRFSLSTGDALILVCNMIIYDNMQVHTSSKTGEKDTTNSLLSFIYTFMALDLAACITSVYNVYFLTRENIRKHKVWF